MLKQLTMKTQSITKGLFYDNKNASPSVIPMSSHNTSFCPFIPGPGQTHALVKLAHHYHGHQPDEPYGFFGDLQQYISALYCICISLYYLLEIKVLTLLPLLLLPLLLPLPCPLPPPRPLLPLSPPPPSRSHSHYNYYYYFYYTICYTNAISLFHMAAIFKANMAAERNIYQLGSHLKELQQIFYSFSMPNGMVCSQNARSRIFYAPICQTICLKQYIVYFKYSAIPRID